MLRRGLRWGMALALFALTLGPLVWPTPMGWLLAQLPRLWVLGLVVAGGFCLGVGAAMMDARFAPYDELSASMQAWMVYVSFFEGALFVWLLYTEITNFLSPPPVRDGATAHPLAFVPCLATLCGIFMLQGVLRWQAWRRVRMSLVSLP